jgi:hypothetical protein
MAEYVPAAERVIDREHECEMFRQLLARASGPCVVTVQDGHGTGKSWLLELLEELAVGADRRAMAVRAVLEQDAELMWLVEQINDGLAASGAPLAQFEMLNLARRAFNYEVFRLPSLRSTTVEVTVKDSALLNSPVTGADIREAQVGWPDGYERTAQKACLDALLDDLRDLSREQAVVVLVDQYERATPQIRGWLDRALLTRVLDEEEAFGPLIIVVASTDPPFPMLAKHLGPRSKDLLYPISHLSPWGDEHIDQWLQQIGVHDRQALRPSIRVLLNEGASLQTLSILAGELQANLKGAR